MAKTFEVKTMKASRVTAKIAGMESSANIRSVVSTSTSTSASGVSATRPLSRARNFWPSYSVLTGKILRMRLLVPGENHFQAGENQERTERHEQPFEAVDEFDAQPDHQPAHEQRAQDAPEEHAMLVTRRNGKMREDEGDDEDIVHRERQLDDIAGDEFDRLLELPVRHQCRRDDESEQHGQGEPHARPRQRLAEFYDMRLAMKHSQVEREENEHAEQKSRPVPRGDLYQRNHDRQVLAVSLLR